MDYNEMAKKYLEEAPSHPYPENMDVARACAADGMVLLRNNNNVLPLTDRKIALFGSGATDTVTCGTGSGYAPAPYVVNVLDGFKNAEIEITSKKWLKRFIDDTEQANEEDKTLTPVKRIWSGVRIHIDELPINEEELMEATDAKTAIYVIRRNAGEDKDRIAKEGDYFLSKIERDNLALIGQHFDKTIVVLNSCVIDANFINDIPGLDSLLLMGLAGNESGNALVDVLLGKVTPSGKLTDTWAKKYSDYPASETFGLNDGNALQEDYCEDIYVGYRYFDSFGIEPLYPFGYGLSYTTFKCDVVDYSVKNSKINLMIQVKNIGDFSGKEVVQVYVSAPNGRLKKPYQELIGFSKTSLLEPNGQEVMSLKIPLENLTSYDEKLAAFILEPGKYKVRVGNDSKNTKVVFAIEISDEIKVREVNNEMIVDHALHIIEPSIESNETCQVPIINLQSSELTTIDGRNKIQRVTKTLISKENNDTKDGKPYKYQIPFDTKEIYEIVQPDFKATLIDVAEGRTSLESFVASLHAEVLCRIVAGDANETDFKVKKRMKKTAKANKGINSSGSTTGLYVESLGIPNCRMTDGPAGLHVIGGATTSFPVGMVLAQTWDEKYCEKIGIALGKEMNFYNFSVILGPAMNIHRDPLCGRSFEYYSEDPLITGKIGAAITRGVQSNDGSYVAIKHFACNNQETMRTETNSTVSERALREIYLKGFEICVREAQPATLMTSYNKINGIYASSHYELLTEILRGEWGFEGMVMTDWGTSSTKPFDLHAGNDLIMGGFRSQYLMAALDGIKPQIEEDGFVKVDTYDVYGGFMKEKIENWNAFLPQKDGPDTVTAILKSGTKMNKAVEDYVEKGIAKVSEDNGKIIITYSGIDRGTYLKLGDLQKCAMNVLKSIIESSAYVNMVSNLDTE